ncbi:MAG TPA: hypothetical protein VKB86_07925, partial [Pyrinomonadaceae bacterium]|nr:hypothetical protein [Pyrinomonadaceae bacterium]
LQNQLNITSTANTWGLILRQNNSGAGSSLYHCALCAHIINFNNAALVFGTNNTDRMRIDGSGNVGIGTTSPGLSLEVAKSQNAGTGIKVGNSTAGTGAFSYFQAASDSNSGYLYAFSSSYTTNNLYVGNGVTLESGVGASGGLNLLANHSGGVIRFGTGGNTERMRIDSSGNVGIGTATPDSQYKLDVAGSVRVSGNIAAKYQDVAEWVQSTHALAAGTVVILNPDKSNQVMASISAYDTRVAGVVSERPGLALGEGGKDKVLVATTGRVKVKVDATRAPIHVGDLLVTSDQEGVAMKSEPVDLGGVKFHRPGTLIGKALEPLEKGTGEILVLLSLQ